MAEAAQRTIVLEHGRVAREVINEILNRKHLPGLVVNPYTDRVVIPRTIFEKIILENERIDS